MKNKSLKDLRSNTVLLSSSDCQHLKGGNAGGGGITHDIIVWPM